MPNMLLCLLLLCASKASSPKRGCGGDARCLKLAAELFSRRAVIGPSTLAVLRQKRRCETLPGMDVDVRGVADFVATKTAWFVTQYPERSDGIGARLWAKINVMVMAEALGLRYVHTPIHSSGVPSFGPTELVGGERPKNAERTDTDWPSFLNFGTLWPAASDVGEIREWIIEDERPGGPDVTLRTAFDNVNATLARARAAQDDVAAQQPRGRRTIVAVPHGFWLVDNECLHPAMWAAFDKVSRLAHLEYTAASRWVPRPDCGYGDGRLHVAVHLRRGDVAPSLDPAKLVRCGRPLFSAAQLEERREQDLQPERFASNFAKRATPLTSYIAAIRALLHARRQYNARLARDSPSRLPAVTIHLYSQTTAPCASSALADFPELDFGPTFGRGAHGDAQRVVMETLAAVREATARDSDEGLGRVHVVLNNDPRACFHCLQSAHVLMAAKSTFSMAAGVLAAPTQLRFFPRREPEAETRAFFPAFDLRAVFEHNRAGRRWLQMADGGGVDEKQLVALLKVWASHHRHKESAPPAAGAFGRQQGVHVPIAEVGQDVIR